MKKNLFSTLVLAFTFIFCFQANANFSNVADTEPVVIEAASLPQILGKPVKHLQVFSFQNGTLKPMPWQWDAIDENGWVDFRKNEAESMVAAKDQLLWLVGDMGQAAAPGILAAYSKKGIWLEVEVGNDQNASHFAYVLLADETVLTPTRDYLTYRTADDLVVTPYFYVGYRDIIVANQFGWIEPDGSFGRNLIDQVSVLFTTRLFFGLLPMKVSEEDLLAKQLGHRDGAIRVTQRLSTQLKLPLGFKGPSNVAESYFYPNSYETNIDIDLPSGGKAMIKDTHFTFNIGLTPPPEGAVVVRLPPDRTIELAPTMTAEDRVVSKPPPSWAQFEDSITKKGFVVHVAIPEKERRVIKIENLTYTSNATSTRMGTVGLTIGVNTRPGKHRFKLFLFSPPQQKIKKKDHDNSFSTLQAYQNLLRFPSKIKQIKTVDLN